MPPITRPKKNHSMDFMTALSSRCQQQASGACSNLQPPGPRSRLEQTDASPAQEGALGGGLFDIHENRLPSETEEAVLLRAPASMDRVSGPTSSVRCRLLGSLASLSLLI